MITRPLQGISSVSIWRIESLVSQVGDVAARIEWVQTLFLLWVSVKEEMVSLPLGVIVKGFEGIGWCMTLNGSF